MKLGVMQPYLFPYIGYFQLINAVDTFVLRDDVQYIKGGWINRNNILINGKTHMFQFSLKKDHQKALINERIMSPKFFSVEYEQFKKTIHCAYKKAPMYTTVTDIIFDILDNMHEGLAEGIEYSIRSLCKYMDIKTDIEVSSKIGCTYSMERSEALHKICHTMNADKYINSIGGQNLYSKEAFQDQGIELNFIQTRPVIYKQYENEFIPNLSIIDVMMFNSKETIQQMLEEYELL